MATKQIGYYVPKEHAAYVKKLLFDHERLKPDIPYFQNRRNKLQMEYDQIFNKNTCKESTETLEIAAKIWAIMEVELETRREMAKIRATLLSHYEINLILCY